MIGSGHFCSLMRTFIASHVSFGSVMVLHGTKSAEDTPVGTCDAYITHITSAPTGSVNRHKAPCDYSYQEPIFPPIQGMVIQNHAFLWTLRLILYFSPASPLTWNFADTLTLLPRRSLEGSGEMFTDLICTGDPPSVDREPRERPQNVNLVTGPVKLISILSQKKKRRL